MPMTRGEKHRSDVGIVLLVKEKPLSQWTYFGIETRRRTLPFDQILEGKVNSKGKTNALYRLSVSRCVWFKKATAPDGTTVLRQACDHSGSNG